MSTRAVLRFCGVPIFLAVLIAFAVSGSLVSAQYPPKPLLPEQVTFEPGELALEPGDDAGIEVRATSGVGAMNVIIHVPDVFEPHDGATCHGVILSAPHNRIEPARNVDSTCIATWELIPDLAMWEFRASLGNTGGTIINSAATIRLTLTLSDVPGAPDTSELASVAG